MVEQKASIKMRWLKTLGIFLKGLFQTLNNPKRLEIKEIKLQEKIKEEEERQLIEDEKIKQKLIKEQTKTQNLEIKHQNKRKKGPLIGRFKRRRNEK